MRASREIGRAAVCAEEEARPISWPVQLSTLAKLRTSAVSLAVSNVDLCQLGELAGHPPLNCRIIERPREIRAASSKACTCKTLFSLGVQFDGAIIVFNRGDIISTEALKKMLDRRTSPEALQIVDTPAELGYRLARRETGLLIELGLGQHQGQIGKDYGTPSHFPRYVEVSSVDGLVSALTNQPAWLQFAGRYAKLLRPKERDVILDIQKERIASDREATVSIISGHVGSKTDKTIKKLISAVAKSTRSRRVFSPNAARPLAGFMTGYSSRQLAKLLSIPGARLVVATKADTLLGYYLFFTKEKYLPARGKELAEALRSNQSLPDKARLGYAKIMEVTPAGRDFGRILGVDLYKVLQTAALDESRRPGVSFMIGECRGFPYPNREALRAHTNHGWTYSKVCLIRAAGQGRKSVAAIFTRSTLPEPEKAVPAARTNDFLFPRRSLRSGASSPFNTRLPRQFGLTPSQRLQDADKVLNGADLSTFLTGSNLRCQEYIELRRLPQGGFNISRWIWDDVIGAQVFSESHPVNALGEVLSDASRVDDLLALIRLYGANPNEIKPTGG